jgi:hypothetical protein
MKIESTTPDSVKHRYKVVRTDNYKDIPGEIITANDEEGTCVLSVPVGQGAPAENKEFNLGPGNFKIVLRR